MTFWFITGGLAFLVAALIALGLRAPKRGLSEPAAAYDLRVYRDQLRDVDKDLARGVVADGRGGPRDERAVPVEIVVDIAAVRLREIVR